MSRRKSQAPAALGAILPKRPVGQQLPIVSVSATRYAHDAALESRDTSRELNGFPRDEPCVYLCMKTDTSRANGPKKDFLGLAANDLVGDWADLDMYEEKGHILTWPVVVIGGFSRDPGKGLLLATAFYHMWKTPAVEVWADGLKWAATVRDHRDGDALSLKHLHAEVVRDWTTCSTECWGERVHTLAVLLSYPLWRKSYLRVYCFHPSFGDCLARARERAERTAARFPELYPPTESRVSLFAFYDVQRVAQEGESESEGE